MNAAAAAPMIQHITQFFHYASNDDKFYHITCRLILQGYVSLDDHNYDHGFFYNINPTATFYVTCKIFSHSLIVNNNIYGIDIGINNSEQKESLSLNQKLDLERDLKKQILSFHLTHHHIPDNEISTNSYRNSNSSYGQNTQGISINSQINSFTQQNGVGYYTNNITNSQQQVNFNNIPHVSKGLNSFCGNIGNNVMTTQAVSITDSQDNGFPHPNSTSAAPQNRVTHVTNNSQQQIDSNNIPQHITDRGMRLNYYENTNSFHGNDVNNTLAASSALTTDINQIYQNVNRIRETRQQVDLNNNYKDSDSHNRNIGNSVTTTQVNGLTYVHQDINQVTQPQQQADLNDNNYRNTDSRNGNIGNNVMATQSNGLTCISQVTQPQQQVDINDNNNYEDTGSHNGNIENNVTTQANSLTCDYQV